MTITQPLNGARLASLAFIVLSASIACSGNYGTGTNSRGVAAVSVSVPASEIEVGESITAIAVALDQYGAPFNAGPTTWSSTFPAVATVDPTTGAVKAIASGMTEITASIKGTVGRRTVTFSWTVDVATSYGRCANGVGGLVVNTGITRGGANACP